MSRLIVKNLPSKVDALKLRKKFEEVGKVTDVQLRHTPDGKFRRFAFIGYKTDEEAREAIEHFHNTCYNTAKISVELCADLGSSDKPQAWSKYAKDSSAYKMAHPVEKEKKPPVEEKKKKKKKGGENDPELLEKIDKHREEPEFREFLEVHGEDRVLGMVGEEERSEEDSGVEFTEDGGEEKPALTAISDMDYLRLKTKVTSDTPSSNSKPAEKQPLFSVKIKNLPKGAKKSDIKAFLKPLAPASLRKAKGLLGIAYVGFRTEKEVKKALIKNKSFMKGKQVSVSECRTGGPGEKGMEEKVGKWQQQEEELKEEEGVGESGRIFVRNLCYDLTEEELESLFSKFGPVSEVSLPVDKFTRKGKGYGLVTFMLPEHAAAAFSALDGTAFQGRMLHLLPAKAREEEVVQSGSYKDKKKAELKKTAGSSHNWNTLFLGRNAVAELIADRYKASKGEVLTGRDGAVRLALGETQLVASTREFLVEQGVSLDAFNRPPERRSRTVILVKNLPAKTTVEEVQQLFSKWVVSRLILPPTGVTAIVEFEAPVEARAAFMKLAYSNFKGLPLYLEWAPEDVFAVSQSNETGASQETANDGDRGETSTRAMKIDAEGSSSEGEDPEPDTTLYVKNINFQTTEAELRQHFLQCGKLHSVTICTKKDTKNPGATLSMGYGFVQYLLRSDTNKALAELQGVELGGHILELKRSDRARAVTGSARHKGTNVAKQTGTKILVRNIPFQAGISELRKLFSTFGNVKSLRLPKKMAGTGSHRGFGFVDYGTRHEAKLAMKALASSTHLYGRRLVLEWAQTEEEDLEALMKKTASHLQAAEPSRISGKATASMEDMQHDSNSDMED